MMKRILAIILGLIISFIIISLFQKLGHKLYPPPEGINMNDKEAIKTLVASMPMGAFIVLLISYMLGAFGGGFIAARVSKDRIRPSIIVGAVLMLAGLVNVIMIPHPLWFAILSIIMYIPMAYTGGKLGLRKTTLNDEAEREVKE